jgi:hypothetical protein
MISLGLLLDLAAKRLQATAQRLGVGIRSPHGAPGRGARRRASAGSSSGGAISTKQITAHWDEALRLASSIQQGTVTAALMLRKLGAYPRQNALALALREIGKLECTLFLLDYIQNIELRKRIHAGLNKGEARNALARAVFFNRLGELRDQAGIAARDGRSHPSRSSAYRYLPAQKVSCT